MKHFLIVLLVTLSSCAQSVPVLGQLNTSLRKRNDSPKNKRQGSKGQPLITRPSSPFRANVLRFQVDRSASRNPTACASHGLKQHSLSEQEESSSDESVQRSPPRNAGAKLPEPPDKRFRGRPPKRRPGMPSGGKPRKPLGRPKGPHRITQREAAKRFRDRQKIHKASLEESIESMTRKLSELEIAKQKLQCEVGQLCNDAGISHHHLEVLMGPAYQHKSLDQKANIVNIIANPPAKFAGYEEA